MTLEEDIELVGLPEEGDFKVIQIMFDGHPLMICGPESKLHTDLLGEYLTSKGIKPKKIIIETKKLRKELICVEGERYKVVGMGHCNISSQTKSFQLPYGGSVDYQDYVRGTNPDFRARLKQQFSGWNF